MHLSLLIQRSQKQFWNEQSSESVLTDLATSMMLNIACVLNLSFIAAV